LAQAICPASSVPPDPLLVRDGDFIMDVFLSASMVLFHVFRASAEYNAPGAPGIGRVGA
jgi:hypothetical protein